jgi:release factor glutamine methyltransferase
MAMTGRQALGWASNELKKAGFSEEAAGRESRLLLSHLWGRTGLNFILNLGEAVPEPQLQRFQEWIRLRGTGTPLQYLTGVQDFMGADYQIVPGVLVPRQDTEILVQAALRRSGSGQRLWALDLGTGSGAILGALALRRPELRGVGIDRNPIAAALARSNFQRLGLEARLTVLEGSWFEPLQTARRSAVDGLPNPPRFDLILSNPPYISTAEMEALPADVKQEPESALWGGEDGLDCYRYLIPAARPFLNEGGWFLVEIGWLQGSSVRTMFLEAGYVDVEILQDLGHRDRVVCGRLPSK